MILYEIHWKFGDHSANNVLAVTYATNCTSAQAATAASSLTQQKSLLIITGAITARSSQSMLIVISRPPRTELELPSHFSHCQRTVNALSTDYGRIGHISIEVPLQQTHCARLLWCEPGASTQWPSGAQRCARTMWPWWWHLEWCTPYQLQCTALCDGLSSDFAGRFDVIKMLYNISLFFVRQFHVWCFSTFIYTIVRSIPLLYTKTAICVVTWHHYIR